MNNRDAVEMSHGRTEEQKAVMQQILEDGADPFDWTNLARYHHQPVLRKGAYWLVTPSDFPYEGTEIHLLLIYRDRARHLHEVEPQAFVELQEMLVWIEKEYQIDHGAFLMRFGAIQFCAASVDHLHAHIIVGAKEKTSHKLKVSIGYVKK